jgi:hypothetical protein
MISQAVEAGTFAGLIDYARQMQPSGGGGGGGPGGHGSGGSHPGRSRYSRLASAFSRPVAQAVKA